MSDQTSTAAAPAAPPPRRRRPQTVRNMLWSLLPLLALVALFVVLFQPGKQPVNTIDPKPDLNYASRQLGVTVPAPSGLPAKWRATSSAMHRGSGHSLSVEIGYLSPANQYVKLVEGDPSVGRLVTTTVPGSSPQGSVTIDGVAWSRYRTPRGEIALAARRGRISAVITGSAQLDELRAMADSLR